MKILMDSPTPKIFMGFVAGAVASIFWGFHPVAIRYLILDGVNPAAIADIRLFLGAFTLFIFLGAGFLWRYVFFPKQFPLRSVQKKPVLPRDTYFWLAVLALSANFLFFHEGLKHTLASDAILLEAFSPIVVLMLLLYFLPEHIRHIAKNPKIMGRLMLVAIVGTIGAAFILINDQHNILLEQGIKLKGDILELFAMFFFGVFMFANHEYQRREKAPALPTITLILFFTGVIISPFVPWKILPNLFMEHWKIFLLLGISSTGLAYIFWQIAAKYLDAVPLAMLFFSLSSVFNVGIESLIFNLALSPKLILGGLLIIAASVITQILLQKGRPPEFIEKDIPPSL